MLLGGEMKRIYRKHKKAFLITGLILLTAVIVWAAAELAGQANSMAQDAGANSAEMEMVTLDTIKKPQKTKESPTQPPPCDWQLERKIKKEIDAEDSTFKNLSSSAKSEMNSSGEVSGSTAGAVRESASRFKGLTYQYADLWDDCNCRTRANTARKAGDSRIKSAEVVAGEIDKDKLDAMDAAQNDMAQARREYVTKASAGDELSPEDKEEIRSNVTPVIQRLFGQVQYLVGNVLSLISEIQSQIDGGTSIDVGTLISVVSSVAQGEVPMVGLLGRVQTLLSVSQSLLGNVSALRADADALYAGGAPMGASGSSVVSALPASCFISATE